VDVLTNEDEVVCDPFMGSGTAGVVSKRLNRKFIGIELNSKYFELSKKRIDACQETLRLSTLSPLAQER
jgi:DNA modification methylase